VRRPGLLFLLVVVGAWATQARAAERPRLRVEVDPCVGVPAAAVRRDVAVELDALLVEARDSDALDTTSVSIGCADGLVRVSVEDPLSGKQLVRRIDPARESTKGRARLLALAAVELVSASWLELRVGNAPSTAVDATASAAARQTAAASVARIIDQPSWTPAWRVALLGAGRGFSSPFTRNYGAQLNLQRDLRRGLAVEAGVSGERGDAEVSLGRVASLLGSSSLTVVVRSQLDGWGLEAGLGGRIGLVRLVGTPATSEPDAEGRRAVRPWGGPLLLLRPYIPIGDRVALFAGLETGLVTLPVAGLVDGLVDLALEGFWLTIGAGVTVALGEPRGPRS